MKKGIIALVLLGLITGTAFADFSRVSVRLQGVNPVLSGILADEYTDVLDVNPADLLNVEGYRIYTNMSNLYGGTAGINIGNDRALNGATTGGAGAAQFLLGGFGNPIKGFLPDSQMGLFYNSASNIEAVTNNLGVIGERVLNTITQNDSDADGDFNDAGDWAQILDRNAKREIETYQKNYELLFAHPLNDIFKLGVIIDVRNMDVDGNASSKEPIEAADYTSLTTIGTPTTITYQENSLSAEETNTNSTLNIGFGGRYQLTDIMDFGACFRILPTSLKKDRESAAHIYIDNTGAAANPITAEATAVDGNLHTIPGGYGVLAGNVTAGFGWTGNYSAAIAAIPGITGNEIGTMKQDGTGIGLRVDSHYDLTDEVKVVARIGFQSVPQDLSADLSLPYTETLRSNVIAGDKSTENNNTTYEISGDVKDSTIGLTLGGETKLQDDILLGFGLIYTNQNVKTDGSYIQSVRNISTYDEDNDGNVTNDTDDPLDLDQQITITETNKGSFLNETKTNTLQFPIGLEMRKWEKVSFRLGINHRIEMVKTTATTKVTKDGHRATVAWSNSATAPDPVYTGGAHTTNEVTTVTEETDGITQYYYGLGYDWSENISFDILGLASGNDILDLNNWRIGCTMKF